MKKNEIVWKIVYYVLIFALSWYATYEGPALSAVLAYKMSRAAQKIAGFFGATGIELESYYWTHKDA